MFEAELKEAGILKKILDAIKDLLNEAMFDFTESGIQVQSMDSSHVSLVSLNLRAEGFQEYRCDRNIALGMNLKSLEKILKCCQADDLVTIKAQDDGDVITFKFVSKNEERVSEFDMKLMNIDQEHLAIPDTDYDAVVKMPSGEFARIVRDLTQLGESITISCTKAGVKFSSSGDIGTGNVKVFKSSSIDGKTSTTIQLNQPVSLTFASKYLSYFTKASGLSDHVTLNMSTDVPFVVEFKILDLGYIRYYLAPKIEDGDFD